jgi:hypothetical protein
MRERAGISAAKASKGLVTVVVGVPHIFRRSAMREHFCLRIDVPFALGVREAMDVTAHRCSVPRPYTDDVRMPGASEDAVRASWTGEYEYVCWISHTWL